MGFCKDPSLTSLNKFGYNVIRLPRTGIEPMLVLGKGQSLELLGKLSSVWRTTAAEPQPAPPATVADLEGTQSDKLELSIGLKVLANALQGLGALTPSLDFGFTRARKVQFTYTNVTSTSIAPLEAGSYLASGDLLPNPLVAPYFFGEDGHAFLIVDVLKSETVTVQASDEHGEDVAVDIPAIQSAVGAKIGVKSSNASGSKISFKGEKAITFGFKAFAIAFENGKWTLKGSKASQDMAFGFDEDDEELTGGVLFTTTGMVSL